MREKEFKYRGCAVLIRPTISRVNSHDKGRVVSYLDCVDIRALNEFNKGAVFIGLELNKCTLKQLKSLIRHLADIAINRRVENLCANSN